MANIDVSKAKISVSDLLKHVAKGEQITIARQGVPVAILQPVDSSGQKPVREIISELKQFRAKHRLSSLSIREMMEEGRR